MNILVIAAHPDDEVLGCGATLRRLADEGHSVHISILGEGITSRYDKPEQAEVEQLNQLHSTAKSVSELLGAKSLALHGLPDNRFDSVPILDIIKILEKRIAEVQPEIVFTQHGGDLNIDHLCTYRATLTATRPMAGCKVRAVYSYEVMSSTEWAFQKFAPEFKPSVFYDVSATLQTKLDAMALYESEARAFPHPRSKENLCNVAKRWGSVVGISAAEAFEVIREIR
jgi:LmbE family N-acetylglucosaminyl deacetylase